MNFSIYPNKGVNELKFGMTRREVRDTLPSDFFTKPSEPENDFYEHIGLITGYDDNDLLEFIEIIVPSSAEYNGIDFFKLTIKSVLSALSKDGYDTNYDNVYSGYNFEKLGSVLYCPSSKIESVSVYKEGYYDFWSCK